MQTFSLYELPSVDDKILKFIKKHPIDTQYSRFYNQPQLSNGFNVFIHRTKDKMEFVNDPKFKGKSFYHVTNPYEHIINNNSNDHSDITSYSKLYFGIDKNMLGISSRAFYKLWEMLMIFDVMPKSGPIISAHLAEAPGSFVQAVMFYREKFYKKAIFDKDEHFTISLDEVGIPAFKKDFRKAYNRVKIYEQDGGDLTNLASINKFNKFSKKADFITADGGFEWINENYQEQEAYRLVLGEIITALKTQKIGGTFIIKLFEIYTDVSIKILMLLSSVYEKSFIFKPFTSRPSNSERYMICKDFKGIDSGVITKLESLLTEMNTHHSEGLEISNLLEQVTITPEYKNTINTSSIMLSNSQFVAINKMVKYVKSNNYFGDQYHQYLSQQQHANDYWVQTFYPVDNLDLRTVQRTLSTTIDKAIADKNEEISNYTDSIL